MSHPPIPVPNPGSDEAIEKGCTCPVLDNAHGRGFNGGKFWIAQGCMLHHAKEPIGEDSNGHRIDAAGNTIYDERCTFCNPVATKQ